MASNRIGTVVKTLGLALLNATLMLIVIALALSAFVVWQARELAHDMRIGVQDQVAVIQTHSQEARHAVATVVGALDGLDRTALRQCALVRPEFEPLETGVTRLASSVEATQATLQSLAGAEGQSQAELSEIIAALIQRVVAQGLAQFVGNTEPIGSVPTD